MTRFTTIALFALAAAPAAAQSYTTVYSPPGSEKGHAKILSDALGETFSSSGSRDFSSTSFYADRVKDKHDKTWTGRSYNVEIIGHEAGYDHTLGFVQDGDFTGLLRSDNVGSSTNVNIDGSFQWAIKNDKKDGGDLWTSKYTQNSDWHDHMVTYALYSNDTFAGFAIFFEDLPKWCSDKDYNDVAAILTIVPTPQSAGLALLGLGGVGFSAGRRRR